MFQQVLNIPPTYFNRNVKYFGERKIFSHVSTKFSTEVLKKNSVIFNDLEQVQHFNTPYYYY